MAAEKKQSCVIVPLGPPHCKVTAFNGTDTGFCETKFCSHRSSARGTAGPESKKSIKQIRGMCVGYMEADRDGISEFGGDFCEISKKLIIQYNKSSVNTVKLILLQSLFSFDSNQWK